MQNGFVAQTVFYLINNVGAIPVHKADKVHGDKNNHVLSVIPWHAAVLRCQDNLTFITAWSHDAQKSLSVI
jgi:hypothetical protein